MSLLGSETREKLIDFLEDELQDIDVDTRLDHMLVISAAIALIADALDRIGDSMTRL